MAQGGRVGVGGAAACMCTVTLPAPPCLPLRARSGEQAEAIEKEGIRPDVFLLINVSEGRPFFYTLFYTFPRGHLGALRRGGASFKWC